MKYIALLRGINVGGKAKVPMAELRNSFESLGYSDVRTYINSGNVIFESEESDQTALKIDIEDCIQKQFNLNLQIILIESTRYKKILNTAPVWWGRDTTWKHNLIFVIEPYDMKEVVAAIGELKPDIEAICAGDGYVYQSLQFDKFGQTTTGKLASSPVYKKMTIRNYNTSQKLLTLL